jgi:hypothetical protein
MPGKRFLLPLLILLLLTVIVYALYATVLRLPAGRCPRPPTSARSARAGVSGGRDADVLRAALRNRSGESVSLEKIEPLRRVPGVEIRGIRVVTKLPPNGATDAAGFPPKLGGGINVRRVKDVSIDGGETARAAIGIRLTKPAPRRSAASASSTATAACAARSSSRTRSRSPTGRERPVATRRRRP